MIDLSFMKELQHFSLLMNKKVTSRWSGARKTPITGTGTIFKDHRIYAPGDNFKAIDWKVYARTDDLYVKVYEEERNLQVHILVDSSKSMAYKEKFEYAGKIGLGIAFLALKNNETVHFSTFSNSIDIFRGQKGREQLFIMLKHYNSISPSGTSDLFQALQEYKSRIHSKSYIVIISDFLMDEKRIEQALSLLSGEHTVKLIQVLDGDEVTMPFEGDFKLIDSESRTELRTYISKRSQTEYVNRLGSHVSDIKTFCNATGLRFYQFSTETPIFDSFFELINE